MLFIGKNGSNVGRAKYHSNGNASLEEHHPQRHKTGELCNRVGQNREKSSSH